MDSGRLTMDRRLHDLTAGSAVRAMVDREVAPSEYLEALLRRIEATEHVVQAWETIDVERAMEAARLRDGRLDEASELPLYGVPLGLKDVIDVEGFPTAADYDPYRAKLPARDSAVAQAVRAAGAVPLGKTVSTQFAWSYDTPKTRNPWNPAHTPGGSTSGTAAAVAARQIPVGLGTQTTASLLRPAAYCGVVALKPTYGRVSCAGIHPTSWTSDHPGIACRSVADAALVLGVIAGHDARDPHSAPFPREDFMPTPTVDSPGLSPRFGCVRELYDRATPEVRGAFDAAIGRLSAQGAEIRDVPLPGPMDLLLSVHWVIQNVESASLHFDQFSRESEHYRPTVKASLEVSELVPAAVYVHAKRWKRELRPGLLRMFDECDVLIAPTSSDKPPARGLEKHPLPLGDPSFQVPWTCFGLPNVTLPTGVGNDGLPDAVQLIAKPLTEGRLLQVGAWCEIVFGPLPTPIE
jgi:aspartyl-tRNA(Asn)/glutamyl-tRNA(Gln) amidotransferase subunit A